LHLYNSGKPASNQGQCDCRRKLQHHALLIEHSPACPGRGLGSLSIVCFRLSICAVMFNGPIPAGAVYVYDVANRTFAEGDMFNVHLQ